MDKSKSWLVRPAEKDCAFGAGKCELRHNNGEFDCIFKNKEYCPYREIENEKK